MSAIVFIISEISSAQWPPPPDWQDGLSLWEEIENKKHDDGDQILLIQNRRLCARKYTILIVNYIINALLNNIHHVILCPFDGRLDVFERLLVGNRVRNPDRVTVGQHPRVDHLQTKSVNIKMQLK